MDWDKQLANVEGFEWDTGNITKSSHKHQVNCDEAEEIFFNRPLLWLDDPIHSQSEPRAKVFGVTNAGRHLTVSFTIRGNHIRIISARSMNRREKRKWEEK